MRRNDSARTGRAGATTGTRSRVRSPRVRLPDIPTIAFVLVVLLAVLGGGSSRADALSLLYLRPALLIVGVSIALLHPDALAVCRRPIVLLALLAATIAVQLVPLPPALWIHLPGHARFAEAAKIAGISQPWRPISISPSLTWNALVSLVPPAAGLIVGAALAKREEALVAAILLSAIASALLSIVQFTAIADSVSYLYRLNAIGIPAGIFSNRNHHAAFLAASLPIIGVWIVQGAPSKRKIRAGIGTALTFLFIASAAVSGSRSGLVLLVPGLLMLALTIAIALYRPSRHRHHENRLRRYLFPAIAMALLLLLIVGIFLLRGTAAMERLHATTDGLGDDQRLLFLPIVLDMVRIYFPFGAGFGVFDPAFRMLEPDTALNVLYFNHAHNDLLELVATGGLPALLVLLAALGALARLAWRLIRHVENRTMRASGIAALSAMALLMAASLTDYPLRTPLLSIVFALLWLLAERCAASPLYPKARMQ